MTDHPEETLSLVRFDLRVEENVFTEEIVRNLQTPVSHPVLAADLVETPEGEVSQGQLAQVVLSEGERAETRKYFSPQSSTAAILRSKGKLSEKNPKFLCFKYFLLGSCEAYFWVIFLCSNQSFQNIYNA